MTLPTFFGFNNSVRIEPFSAIITSEKIVFVDNINHSILV